MKSHEIDILPPNESANAEKSAKSPSLKNKGLSPDKTAINIFFGDTKKGAHKTTGFELRYLKSPLWKSFESTELKWRTLKACIFPVAIYGCEAWTISKTDKKKITSFEMKCYRKILRISWTERKTNASVLEQLGVKAPQLLNLIKKQKLSYFGHIKRHNTLEKLFLEGTCEGRRGRGRPRRRWTQDIGEWMGVSTVKAGRQALERGEFRQAVWTATSIKDPP